MKILVVSQFYSPDITAAAFRIRETVLCLLEQDHDVRVITSFPHKGQAQGLPSDEISDHIIYRTNVASSGTGGLVQYLKHYLSFVLGSIWQGRKVVFSSWRPDVIWVTSPPLFTSLIGYALKKSLRRPLVFDVRDIWPDSAVSAEQISSAGLAFRIGKILERKSYSWAAHMTSVSAPMAAYLREKSNTPVTVIYNGIMKNNVKNRVAAAPKKRIIYAGNFGRVQGLDILIQAFDELHNNSLFENWKVILIGSGAFQNRLEQMISERQLGEKIKIHPPMTKDRVMIEMAESALLFLNLKGDDVFKLTIPSKVFDYMQVGRPILGGILGEGVSILNKTGANLCFQPNDKESLKAVLEEAVINLPLLERNAPKNPELVSNEYNRVDLTKKLVSVFELVVGR